jgi:hypothetical protein
VCSAAGACWWTAPGRTQPTTSRCFISPRLVASEGRCSVVVLHERTRGRRSLPLPCTAFAITAAAPSPGVPVMSTFARTSVAVAARGVRVWLTSSPAQACPGAPALAPSCVRGPEGAHRCATSDLSALPSSLLCPPPYPGCAAGGGGGRGGGEGVVYDPRPVRPTLLSASVPGMWCVCVCVLCAVCCACVCCALCAVCMCVCVRGAAGFGCWLKVWSQAFGCALHYLPPVLCGRLMHCTCECMRRRWREHGGPAAPWGHSCVHVPGGGRRPLHGHPRRV